jgi:hypothetical protein
MNPLYDDAMHVTPEFAGLIAQVFPTLIIALLIEGRLRVTSWRARWLDMLNRVVRFLSIFLGASATFLCLALAGGGKENVLTNLTVTLAWYALGLSFTFMLGHILGTESMDIGDQFRNRPKSKESNTRA